MASKKPNPLRAQIRDGVQLRRERVTIPGVDAELYVRELTAQQMQEQLSGLDVEAIEAAEKGEVTESSRDGMRQAAGFVIATLVDADGEPVYEPGDEDEILSTFPTSVLIEIQRAASAVNRTQEDEKKD